MDRLNIDMHAACLSIDKNCRLLLPPAPHLSNQAHFIKLTFYSLASINGFHSCKSLADISDGLTNAPPVFSVVVFTTSWVVNLIWPCF